MTREEAIAEYYKGGRGNKFTKWLADLTSVAIESHCFPLMSWMHVDPSAGTNTLKRASH